jgi:hypothetical protein
MWAPPPPLPPLLFLPAHLRRLGISWVITAAALYQQRIVPLHLPHCVTEAT